MGEKPVFKGARMLLARHKNPHALCGNDFRRAEVMLARLVRKRLPAVNCRRERVRKMIDGELSKGKSLAEMKAGLNGIDALVLDSYVLSGENLTQKQAAKRMGRSLGTLAHALSSLEDILLGKKKREDNGGKVVRRVRGIIKKKLSEGKSIAEIKEEAGLNETEREVLDAYVLSENRTTQLEAARKLGKAQITVAHSVRFIENKLNGRDGRYHLIRRYAELGDHELEEEIRRLGVKSRVEAADANYWLYKVAKERGVLDRMFPLPKIKRLRDAFEAALQERGLEGTLSGLTDLERAIINRMVLCRVSPSVNAFATQAGLTPDKVSRTIERLAGKLRGKETVPKTITENLLRLRKSVKELDGDKRAELKLLLDEKELAIFERRVIPEMPESLKKIGEELSLSRERMRQVEGRMLPKIERWSKGGRFKVRKVREGKRVKRIKKAIESMISEGKSMERITENLDEAEREVLDAYVLPEDRITMREAARELLITTAKLDSLVETICDKLAQ